MDTSVYRTTNGNTYIAQPDGSFLVVRLDGGTETRWTLPVDAQRMVAAGDFALGLA